MKSCLILYKIKIYGDVFVVFMALGYYCLVKLKCPLILVNRRQLETVL